MKKDPGIADYKKRFEKFGVSPKSLKWESQRAAEQRYEQLVADLDFEGKKILDVGCGFGGIIPYISRKTKNFEYKGVDIVPEFIGQVKRLYPEHDFEIRDYFKNPLNEKFDVILSSGALNPNIRDNMGFRKRAMKTMFENAKEAIVFNMAGAHPQPKTAKRSNVWFADPLEILEYCLSLTKKVVLRNHYHSRDFTVVMFK